MERGLRMRNIQLDNFVSGLDAMKRERLEGNLNNTDMKRSEIDWEQRRYDIAKEMLPAIYVDDKPQEGEDYLTLQEAVNEAVRYADALINELKKCKDNESRADRCGWACKEKEMGRNDLSQPCSL